MFKVIDIIIVSI